MHFCDPISCTPACKNIATRFIMFRFLIQVRDNLFDIKIPGQLASTVASCLIIRQEIYVSLVLKCGCIPLLFYYYPYEKTKHYEMGSDIFAGGCTKYLDVINAMEICVKSTIMPISCFFFFKMKKNG